MLLCTRDAIKKSKPGILRLRNELQGNDVIRNKSRKSMVLLAIVLVQLPFPAYAQTACKEIAGRFASIEGPVQVRGNEMETWVAAKPAQRLCKGDTIRVGDLGRAAVVLVNQAVMRLDQNTTMRLVDISGKKEQRSLVDLVKGTIQAFIRKPRLLSVNTPYLNGSIEGTEFQVSVRADSASILVQEGRILASNEYGKLAVKPGEVAEAQAGAAPTSRILVNPRDAVQWTLYYPPILATPSTQGDATASMASLDAVAEGDRDANFHIQRAALLLSVGRQDEARGAIDAALKQDPNAGQAHALRAIIHVVRNEREQALAEGERAVALSDTAATRIALSYAQQADFRIEAARDTLLAAVRSQPDSPLAWARLSELWLMLGDKAQSRAAADKATRLAPNLARTQLVRGFAALADYDSAEARTRFRHAIELDSSDPMAHLGLGLAEISSGELETGRSELEVAVALDANQALLRAYLGKAYFEEKRTPLDSQQFDIAKQFDPHDPTAYLYDGILKQTLNRPVEALADLEQSRALNDDRAVYRSSLLLDKDRAARGTSLARVYKDLGFVELGVEEATNSLSIDPANASAHRFLSDSYQGVRRREIARVSELLQAQMLQDININPIQPSTSEANLNITTAGGPASAGFNEFTPLFQRNQTQFDVAALAGNNGTQSVEAALSGLYNKVSFGLSALTYDTDGWRPNNGLQQDLYNVFVQAALTDQLNVQAEFRRRKTTSGDLAFNFDPDYFLNNSTTKRKQDTARLGLRYSPTPDTHFLFSYIHGKRTDDFQQVTDEPPFGPFVAVTASEGRMVDETGDQVEAQVLHDMGAISLILGAAWSESEREDDVNISVDADLFGTPTNLLAIAGQEKHPVKDPRGYAYAYIRSGSMLTWTIGASYDNFEEGFDQSTFKKTSFNPKLGVQWDISPGLQFRAAAFQVVRPALLSNQSLEPTQVAGFNQLFDDIHGTQSQRYGVALDWRASRDVKAGVELTHRTLDEPLFDVNVADFTTEERKEQWHRLYLDWTPSPRLALHGELVYDLYRSESGILTESGDIPERVETWSLPVGLSYFAPSGFFAGLGATYVNQSVRRSATATLAASGAGFQVSGDDNSVVVDASIGYRFPKRLGILSLAVKNLFDTEFQYQDDSYREFRGEAATGPYFPDRTVMARFSLSF